MISRPFLSTLVAVASSLGIALSPTSSAHAGGTVSGSLTNITCADGYLIYSLPSPSTGSDGGLSWTYNSGPPSWTGTTSGSTGSWYGEMPFRIQCEGTSLPSSTEVSATIAASAQASGQMAWAQTLVQVWEGLVVKDSETAAATSSSQSSDQNSHGILLTFDLDSSDGGDFVFMVNGAVGIGTPP